MAFDLDDIFPYYTVKYAHIKDRRLGLIQKFLMLAIVVKIGVMTILYQCNHLLDVPVIGSARANSQQPTIDGCNPMHEDCMSDSGLMLNTVRTVRVRCSVFRPTESLFRYLVPGI